VNAKAKAERDEWLRELLDHAPPLSREQAVQLIKYFRPCERKARKAA